MPRFELGMAYGKHGRLYLAVTDRDLLSGRRGVFVVVRPYAKRGYAPMRAVTVADILKAWGVTDEEFTRETMRYVELPRPEGMCKSERVMARAMKASRTGGDDE